MATGACGQGAIQSNEIAGGREKKRKIMMRRGGGRDREGWGIENITSFCVLLLRTMATVAYIRPVYLQSHEQVFSSLLKQKCSTDEEDRFVWIAYILGSSPVCTQKTECLDFGIC